MSHPIKIKFRRVVAPLMPSQSSDGMLVGQYLVVSYAGSDHKSGYAIYNTQGRRLFGATYFKYDDALEMAQFLNRTYEPFFPIWEAYPDADIFAWARWSVVDGQKIYQMLRG